MKAGRKSTGRYKVLSCKQAYHGSTLGAESLRSDIDYTSAFMPGLPGVDHIGFNAMEDLGKIDQSVAIPNHGGGSGRSRSTIARC